MSLFLKAWYTGKAQPLHSYQALSCFTSLLDSDKPYLSVIVEGGSEGRKTFGSEGLKGEAKPESSETVKFVNWQTKGMAQI